MMKRIGSWLVIGLCIAVSLIAMNYGGQNRLKKPLNGFMDVVTRENTAWGVYSTEKQYYTIAEGGKYEETEPFEPEETKVYRTDWYEHESGSDGRRNYLTEYRMYELYTEKEIEVTPVFRRILELIETTEEKVIFHAWILCVRDEYFVCVDRNVNIWHPYVLYYYSAAQDRLIKLATFDDQLPTEIRLSEDFHERVGR